MYIESIKGQLILLACIVFLFLAVLYERFVWQIPWICQTTSITEAILDKVQEEKGKFIQENDLFKRSKMTFDSATYIEFHYEVNGKRYQGSDTISHLDPLSNITSKYKKACFDKVNQQFGLPNAGIAGVEAFKRVLDALGDDKKALLKEHAMKCELEKTVQIKFCPKDPSVHFVDTPWRNLIKLN